LDAVQEISGHGVVVSPAAPFFKASSVRENGSPVAPCLDFVQERHLPVRQVVRDVEDVDRLVVGDLGRR